MSSYDYKWHSDDAILQNNVLALFVLILVAYASNSIICLMKKLCRTSEKFINKKYKTATKLDKCHVIVAFFMVK